MKAIFASSLLTLGLLVTGVAAQEGQWRTATPRPVTNSASPASVAPGVGSAAQLQKPVPLASPSPGREGIRQLTYNSDSVPGFVVRAQEPRFATAATTAHRSPGERRPYH